MPDMVENELQHAQWTYANDEKSTENPIYKSEGKYRT